MFVNIVNSLFWSFFLFQVASIVAEVTDEKGQGTLKENIIGVSTVYILIFIIVRKAWEKTASDNSRQTRIKRGRNKVEAVL